MDSGTILSALIGGFAAAFIAGVASLWVKGRDVKLQAILNQRQEWRERLKELVPLF